MPLPLTVSCSSKIQIGFTFLVPAYPGYVILEKRPLNGCCCYCTTTYYYVFIPLEMHVRLICVIKFYLLTYLLTYLTALGRVLALTLCLYLSVCICPTTTSRTSIETAERIGLIIGTGASFDLSYTVFKEILVTPK